jgi:hypothetical protein
MAFGMAVGLAALGSNGAPLAQSRGLAQDEPFEAISRNQETSA